MTTLAQFYALVSDELRRGTTLDALIPARVNRALRWIEQKYTFRYMEVFGAQNITLGTRSYDLGTTIKKVNFWRVINSDGKLAYLKNFDPLDLVSSGTSRPNGYWVSGQKVLWLDNTPDKDYTAEALLTKYTALPTDTAQSPQVVVDLQGPLIAETCVLFAPVLRDDKFISLQKGILDMEMQSAIDADVESRQSNQSVSMEYGWEENLNRSL